MLQSCVRSVSLKNVSNKSNNSNKERKMAFDLKSISSESRVRAPRIVLLGVEKIGKTTFASKANAPIFLPIKGEEGADAVSVPKFPTINSYQDCLEALGSLFGEHDFGTAVIDSTSRLYPLIRDDVCDKAGTTNLATAFGGYGAGYDEIDKRWREILAALDALRAERNMASILIGHVVCSRFDDPLGESYSTYDFAIQDRVAAMLYQWADAIWFCNTKVHVKTEEVGQKTKKTGQVVANGNRFLYTQKRPGHPGGGRSPWGELPYELPLDWNAVMSAMSNNS
jgi:hypothetical protein